MREQNTPLSASSSTSQEQADWVSKAIFAAELVTATGELLPFTYLKGAAALVSTLLKPIQVSPLIYFT